MVISNAASAMFLVISYMHKLIRIIAYANAIFNAVK